MELPEDRDPRYSRDVRRLPAYGSAYSPHADFIANNHDRRASADSHRHRTIQRQPAGYGRRPIQRPALCLKTRRGVLSVLHGHQHWRHVRPVGNFRPLQQSPAGKRFRLRSCDSLHLHQDCQRRNAGRQRTRHRKRLHRAKRRFIYRPPRSIRQRFHQRNLHRLQLCLRRSLRLDDCFIPYL